MTKLSDWLRYTGDIFNLWHLLHRAGANSASIVLCHVNVDDKNLDSY